MVIYRRCGKVKQELFWRTIRSTPSVLRTMWASVVGRHRSRTWLRDLALDWHTVKTLDKQYMEAQLKHVGTPGPQVIGVDEISIRKGHDYRIVVSDLVRGRPIWFGG